MTRKMLLCVLLLFQMERNASAQTLNQVNNCENIIHQIHADTILWPTNHTSEDLPWMQLSWLKSQLGTPQTANVQDFVYVWKHFSMFVGADGSTEKMGTLPNQLQINNIGEVIQAMGQPKKIYTEALYMYQWVCPTRNHDWIAIITKKDATSIGIMGLDCNEKPCKTFSSIYSESDIKHKFKLQLKEQAEVSLNMLALRLKNYNDYFKTQWRDQTQLTEDIIARIKEYYANLRNCKKGIYQYVIPVLQDFLYQTSIIDKQSGNRCLIETSYHIPNIGKVTLKCKFPVETLSLFSDEAAESTARGFTRIDSQLQKLLNTECKRYIGGVL